MCRHVTTNHTHILHPHSWQAYGARTVHLNWLFDVGLIEHEFSACKTACFHIRQYVHLM